MNRVGVKVPVTAPTPPIASVNVPLTVDVIVPTSAAAARAGGAATAACAGATVSPTAAVTKVAARRRFRIVPSRILISLLRDLDAFGVTDRRGTKRSNENKALK